MAKNIVVFSDGTGQEGGRGHNTNVYKLFNMVEDRTSRQVAFYDRGLGTGGWRKLSGMAFGAGISQNIQECYQFIFENYQAGDQVYLFGFSRGAFTVRSLSGFINLFGILPRSRPELIRRAYKIYKIGDLARRKQQAEAFLAQHHSMYCPIRLIGVWDTVGALGIPLKLLDLLNPFKHKFHDTDLCPNVANGLHALAIDDRRLTFHPTLWNEHAVREGQTVKQVWFAGVHTDVGGGYREEQLSDISLEWMLQQATAQGLRIYPRHRVRIAPDANGFMHDSRQGIARLYRQRQRSLGPDIIKPVVHQSVLERQRDRHNDPARPYQPWILHHEHEVAAWPSSRPWESQRSAIASD